jgi:integrase
VSPKVSYYYSKAHKKWCASFSLGTALDEKRSRRVLYAATKAEVKQKAADLIASRGGQIRPRSLKTVGEYLKAWLDAVKRSLKSTTYETNESAIRVHAKPLVNIRLDALTSAQLDDLFELLEDRNVGGGMRQKLHRVLNAAFNSAVKTGLIPNNPMTGVLYPKHRAREMTVWTSEQSQAFLKACAGDRLEALYVLALTTGMRQGELLGLQWSDIDFREKQLVIRRSIQQLKTTLNVGDPKTASSRRTLNLSDRAIAALRHRREFAWAEAAHRKRRIEKARAKDKRPPTSGRTVPAPLPVDVPWVFSVAHNGGLIHKSNLRIDSFRPLITKAGVPIIRFHDMRHTAACLMLKANIQIKVVSEMLGHSDIKVTLGIYAHVMPGMAREAVEMLDRVIFGS